MVEMTEMTLNDVLDYPGTLWRWLVWLEAGWRLFVFPTNKISGAGAVMKWLSPSLSDSIYRSGEMLQTDLQVSSITTKYHYHRQDHRNLTISWPDSYLMLKKWSDWCDHLVSSYFLTLLVERAKTGSIHEQHAVSLLMLHAGYKRFPSVSNYSNWV